MKKIFHLLIVSSYLIFISSCGKEKLNDKIDPKNPGNFSDHWVLKRGAKISQALLIKSKKFMIVRGAKLADEGAKEMINKSGSAIDGAIAAELVLNVVEPQYSGIGGGAILLYYDAKSKKSFYFNGRKTAPAISNSHMFLDQDGELRQFNDVVKGGLSVAIPGLLKMFKVTHEQYGRLPWKDLFAPAIKIANNGFVVNERLNATANQVAYLKDFDDATKTYLKKDQNGNYVSKNIGEIIVNKKLAKTFEIIAKS